MYSDIISSLLKQQSDNLAKQKQMIIEKRIFDKTGLIVNIITELSKNFPCITVLNCKDHEQWLYNDGSKTGMLLVTFFPLDFKMSYSDEDVTKNIISAKAEIKYI